MNIKAIVLFSGGLDSMVTTEEAIDSGTTELLLLSFLYGATHNAREYRAVFTGCLTLSTKHPKCLFTSKTMQAPEGLFVGAGSALMGEIPITNAKSTIVPFRNGYFLSVAAVLALTHKASRIYIGVHKDDHPYPDCTPEFIMPMHNAIWNGTEGSVDLRAPSLYRSKTRVVTVGHTLGAELKYTYSCYEGRELMCGLCPACKGRIEAFQKAGFIDPAEYEIKIDWKGCEPYERA